MFWSLCVALAMAVVVFHEFSTSQGPLPLVAQLATASPSERVLLEPGGPSGTPEADPGRERLPTLRLPASENPRR